jgi:hypothetical protein
VRELEDADKDMKAWQAQVAAEATRLRVLLQENQDPMQVGTVFTLTRVFYCVFSCFFSFILLSSMFSIYLLPSVFVLVSSAQFTSVWFSSALLLKVK